MSLSLVLYVLALCACTALIVYGIVRPERPRSTGTAVPPLRAATPTPTPRPKRAPRLAA